MVIRRAKHRHWNGLPAPAATTKEIVAKLNALAQTAIKGDLLKGVTELGLAVVGGTPDQFATHLRDDIAKQGGLVKASGMQSMPMPWPPCLHPRIIVGLMIDSYWIRKARELP